MRSKEEALARRMDRKKKEQMEQMLYDELMGRAIGRGIAALIALACLIYWAAGGWS